MIHPTDEERKKLAHIIFSLITHGRGEINKGEHLKENGISYSIADFILINYIPKPAVPEDGELREQIRSIGGYKIVKNQYKKTVLKTPLLSNEKIDEILQLFASQATAAHPFIEGLRCPACGSRGTIFVANGNYLTCSLNTCPNPDYAEAATAAQERAVLNARINELDRVHSKRRSAGTLDSYFVQRKRELVEMLTSLPQVEQEKE